MSRRVCILLSNSGNQRHDVAQNRADGFGLVEGARWR